MFPTRSRNIFPLLTHPAAGHSSTPWYAYRRVRISSSTYHAILVASALTFRLGQQTKTWNMWLFACSWFTGWLLFTRTFLPLYALRKNSLLMYWMPYNDNHTSIGCRSGKFNQEYQPWFIIWRNLLHGNSNYKGGGSYRVNVNDQTRSYRGTACLINPTLWMIAQVWTYLGTAELTAGDSGMKPYTPDQEQQIWIYPVSRQYMITPKLRLISQRILEIPGVVLLCLLIPTGWTGRNGGFKAMLSRARWMKWLSTQRYKHTTSWIHQSYFRGYRIWGRIMDYNVENITSILAFLRASGKFDTTSLYHIWRQSYNDLVICNKLDYNTMQSISYP